MRSRRLTAVLIATAFAVPALPTVLASSASAQSTTRAAEVPRQLDGLHRPGKRVPVKVVLVAQGRIAALDADARTLSLTLRGDRTLTGTVAEPAVVRLNGKKATLADLAAGDRVVVRGWKSGTTVTFTRITARTPHEHPEQPETETPSS